MKRGTPSTRAPDVAALESANQELRGLALPLAAQLVFFRYPPTRALSPNEEAVAQRHKQDVIDRRDSVTHRGEALAWHVRWLFSIYDEHARLADDDNMIHSDEAMNNLLATQRELLYLFDDIVLNAVSLLDYLAQFIAVAITGRGVARWEKFVAAVRRDDGESIFGAEVVDMVTQLNAAWVHELVRHRNYLAHQMASLDAQSSHTIHFDPAYMVTISVDLPPGAKRLLEAMGAGPSETDLIGGAQHIALTSLRACRSLLAAASRTQNVNPRFVPMIG